MDSQTQPAPANSKLQQLGHFGGFAAAYLVMPALLGASLALVDKYLVDKDKDDRPSSTLVKRGEPPAIPNLNSWEGK